MRPSVFHCHQAKVVSHLRSFWLSKLKKFVCMIRCQLYCSVWLGVYRFSFFLANEHFKCELWTDSTGVKKWRHCANAIIMPHFEISKGGLSSRMKQIDRFLFWEIRCMFSLSLCVAKPDPPQPRIRSAASCCPQLALFGAYVTTSESLWLYGT